MKIRYFFLILITFSLALISSINAQQMDMKEHVTNMKHGQMNQPGKDKLNIAVLVYDGALLMENGIAAEMFLAADFPNKFYVYTVSRDTIVSLSIIGLMKPNYLFSNAPRADVIIVPGGHSLLTEGSNEETQKYLRSSLDNGTILYSICTGSVLLAKAGLLENRNATTNHYALGMLEKISPTTNAIDSVNYVDDGNIVTAAGAGTAVGATLHLIERLTTKELAEDVRQKYLNYPYTYKP